MRAWFWSQLFVAGLIVLYAIVAIVWLVNPDLFVFPLGNIMGLFGMPLFALGLVISLVVNQVLLTRRPQRIVTTPERVLLGVEFVLIVGSLAALVMEEWFFEIVALWLLTIGLAIAACVVITITSSRLRAVVQPEPW